MGEYRRLRIGDPAPWFTQRSSSNPAFHFDTVGGRYIVLAFIGTTADPAGQAMSRFAEEHRTLFDDDKTLFFGVSIDSEDETRGRLKESLPGIRQFWDFDATVSKLYGAAPIDASADKVAYRRFWLVLDPMMRVRALFETRPDGGERAELAAYLEMLPPVATFAGPSLQVPIIQLASVLEPDLCERLVGLYRAYGGEESGFMREVAGRTVSVSDHRHKRRSDYSIEDEALKRELQKCVVRRVVPEIEKVHQFKVTRMERYIVACYDSVTGGHFRPHRDNTTKGTAHRRFALSINLNDDFDGGEIGFPEYGPRTFKPPKGGAVVFSCSLLHGVSRVTAGERFAFLPFLYDDAAAAIREANNAYLDESVARYSAQA